MQSIKIAQGLKNIPDAKEIRQIVFVDEQKFILEFDDIDEFAYHIVLYLNDKPVATGRTFPKPNEDGTYIVGRIAVLKEYRKQHLGGLIVRHLEEKAKALGGISTELSAQIHAKGFYEKIGYKAFGEEYMDEHVLHICMKKKI